MTSFVQWLKCEDVNFFILFLCIHYHLILAVLYFYPCKMKRMNDFSFVYRSDRELLGPNNQYLPKIVAVFAEVSLHFWID